MNKRLDDLFSEADKQLQAIEAESCEKKIDKTSEQQEVDQETALRFNETSADKKSYAVRPPYQTGLATIAALLLIAMQVYMSRTLPRATGPYHLVTGTVQSSSIVGVGRAHWGSVVATLPDGRIITIRSDPWPLLRVGTPVAIRVYDTGATMPDRPL